MECGCVNQSCAKSVLDIYARALLASAEPPLQAFAHINEEVMVEIR
jgi:hypothetical protein